MSDSITCCAQIVLYNTCASIATWAIYILNGDKIYETNDTYLLYDTFAIHFDNLNIEAGVKLVIKALVGGPDCQASMNLEYQPDSDNTIYFALNEDDDGNRTLDYVVTVESSEAPPILNCSSLEVYNNMLKLNVAYSISTLDGDELYSTKNYSPDDKWTLDLSKSKLQEGQVGKLKALVYAGSDSTPYLYIKYDPNSDFTGYFVVAGNMFKSVFLYSGEEIS